MTVLKYIVTQAVLGCLQLGAELALQRRQLLLFRHPLTTLYYFGACATSSAWRGMQWSLHHPVMLWCVIPMIAAYATIKPSGKTHCFLCSTAISTHITCSTAPLDTFALHFTHAHHPIARFVGCRRLNNIFLVQCIAVSLEHNCLIG